MSENDNPILVYGRIIEDLLDWFNHLSVPGILIGGVAASLLGNPRATKDIDALVFLDNTKWGRFLDACSSFGFKPRISDALDFAQKNRVLLMQHANTGVNIDISLGALPFEKETIERCKRVQGGLKKVIPIPTPEDLIIMKAVAHRPRDLNDIQYLVESSSKLDKKRIRKWVKEFARVLEMPEILNDLEKILKRN